MGPKDDHILISEMCKYIILHGFADGMKRGFADGMKLMMLRWDYSASIVITRDLISGEASGSESEEELWRQMHVWRERERLEDAPLLTLKLEGRGHEP